MENLQGGHIDLAAYWARIEKTPTCWIWHGAAHDRREGYGTVAVTVTSPRGRATRYELAHRIAWELANGPIPPGLFILHACSNKPCVNPEHLRPGSAQDNMADRRHSPAPPLPRVMNNTLPPPILRARGERHHSAKLTDAQVCAIRDTYATNLNVTAADLARTYGVSKNHISVILKRRGRRDAGGAAIELRPIRGTRVRGTTVKLNESLVVDIRRRYMQGGETIFTLADQIGVSRQHISDVIRGQTWKHVPMPKGLRVRPSYRNLLAPEVDALRRDAADNPDAPHHWLAQRHGVSRATVSLILEGKHHGPNPYGYVPRRRKTQRLL